jgi:hypothetical protein
MLMSQQYRPFRRRQRIVVPPPRVLTTFTAAAVVGMLIIDFPAVGPACLVASYIGLGYSAGRLPTGWTYLHAQTMLILCMVVAMARREDAEVVVFGALGFLAWMPPLVGFLRYRYGR